MIKKFFKHLNTVNKHRWEVFKLSVKVGIPFRGMFHDFSKYSYTEFSESVKYYTDGKCSPLKKCKDETGFSLAWLHHKGRNKHHYEFWYDPVAPEPTPIIPFKYMLEMICDKIAASKTYKGKNYTNKSALEYYYHEEPKMTMNPNLKKFVEEVLTELSEKGEKILKKKHLKELYLKHIK